MAFSVHVGLLSVLLITDHQSTRAAIPLQKIAHVGVMTQKGQSHESSLLNVYGSLECASLLVRRPLNLIRDLNKRRVYGVETLADFMQHEERNWMEVLIRRKMCADPNFSETEFPFQNCANDSRTNVLQGMSSLHGKIIC
ncbi:uncharacterized protein EI90DRAFT_60290 [Cantharellus anzutake]|uniref:uncharacterized protein n=1 Tax=Cantharellus anzutake TaxID=1750568 RepID=UPI001902EE68|nr:uncharacterized protein EI90DRAFT_60290 [Cantharellus anzutake]KAF8344233.1 hypothetical protein EI90DRAFT_60290 [Cantharellus anzutake]